MKYENSRLKDFENNLESRISSEQSAKLSLENHAKRLEEDHNQVCAYVIFFNDLRHKFISNLSL